MYDALTDDVKTLFRLADANVKARGLDGLEQQGWAYFADLDDDDVAMGSLRETDNVFYWMLVASRGTSPTIL
ncbi:MAG: hypothetical protein DLM52_04895 [Chthoniobacterales bacterium]|nr:MAG: hypothetical protein DLM52_04895 [Chthoniobacterales bacterium]